MGEAVLNQDVVSAYKGLMQYAIPLTFGQEVELPSWSKELVITDREGRYLVVLNKLADQLENGDFIGVKMTLAGLTSFYGSRADSGGIPCCPELMIVCGQISLSLQRLFDSGKLEQKRVLVVFKNRLNEHLSFRIRDIVESFRTTEIDRTNLAECLIGFQSTVEETLSSWF